MNDESIGDKLCKALKIFISKNDIMTYRVLNCHPTSLKAYLKIIGGFIESSRETEFNIEEAYKEDKIPTNINDAWEYLSKNPDLAEKYIKDVHTNEYVFFSRDILLRYLN